MLSTLIIIPLVGAMVIGLSSKHFRAQALINSFIAFGFTVWLGLRFDPQIITMQFTENLPWIEWLGLNYHLGMDGLSLSLILLNALLTIIAIVITAKQINRPKLYYSMLLLLNAGVVGAFLAQDLIVFFLFYELEIIPLYFLIAIWGGEKRGYAATKFLLYTAFSGILVLASFLGLVWLSGANSFDFESLRHHVLPLAQEIILLVTLLIGLFIKIPIFPFHTWLPDAHVQASTPISVMLAGILLKLGTYGLIRFAIGLYSSAWNTLAPWLATLAAVSALYGASCAIAQTDMKKVVAYSSIAHMAYVLLAAAAGTRLSIVAAIIQMIAHGLISALLFILVGTVYSRTGTRDVNVLRGLLNPERGLPITGSLMILGVMASAGIPGMVGFVSEFVVFRSSFPLFPVQTILCLVGTGLTAVYFLLMINKVFFGRLTQQFSHMPAVAFQEHIPAFILTILIFVLGIKPNLMTYLSEPQAGELLGTTTNMAQIVVIDAALD